MLLPARPSVTSENSENVGGACSSTCTPRKSSKRLIIRTPTPRKTKKVLVQHTAQPKVRKRLSEDQLTPNKVKVHFRGRNDSKVRTRFIKDSPWVAVLKSLVRGCKAETISKKIFKIEMLKKELVKLMLSDLNSQCQILCKTSKPSVLRGQDEIHFKFESVCSELKERAPMLYDVLQTVTRKRNISRLAVAASVLLWNRNIHMSQVHQIIGQILDHGGATDETIQTLAEMGLSIGPQSVSKKRGKLVLQNTEKLNDNFQKQIRQTVLNHSISMSKRAERSVMEYEPPSADKTESEHLSAILQALISCRSRDFVSVAKCPAETRR